MPASNRLQRAKQSRKLVMVKSSHYPDEPRKSYQSPITFRLKMNVAALPSM